MQEIGHLFFLTEILNNWGERYLEQCRFDIAATIYDDVLAMAREANNKEYEARGLYGQARVAAFRGETAVAHQLGEQSLLLFQQMSHPQSAEVTCWLAQLPVA